MHPDDQTVANGMKASVRGRNNVATKSSVGCWVLHLVTVAERDGATVWPFVDCQDKPRLIKDFRPTKRQFSASKEKVITV